MRKKSIKKIYAIGFSAIMIFSTLLCNIQIQDVSNEIHIEDKNYQNLNQEIQKAAMILGDVNQDGIINIIDATLVAQYYVGLNPANFDASQADVNKDGTINIVDATLIAQYYVGLIIVFPDNSFDQNSTGWDYERFSYATYTGSGYTGGAVLLDPIPLDMEITALNPTDLNYGGINAALAGAYIEVEGVESGLKTVVYVTDMYPEGAPGALDLCPISFEKIGEMVDGIIDIKWRVIGGPVAGNVQYRIKEGSTQYWAAIQVRNHRYPVLKMEYFNDGIWINMKKMPYNHFEEWDMGPEAIQIRITDIRGITLEDTIPPLPTVSSEVYYVDGHVQFPV